MYHCTVDLLFDWFEISCMATENFYFYLQNRLIQTSQTGGQWYSDTSHFSIFPGTGHWSSSYQAFSIQEVNVRMYTLMINHRLSILLL
jgi:hypothetical protein